MDKPDFTARTLIRNQRGLHARAAAKVVKLAATYNAEIALIKEDATANGRSIMGLMMLGASCGTELEVQTQGPDASMALAAMIDLIDRAFDED